MSEDMYYGRIIQSLSMACANSLLISLLNWMNGISLGLYWFKTKNENARRQIFFWIDWQFSLLLEPKPYRKLRAGTVGSAVQKDVSMSIKYGASLNDRSPWNWFSQLFEYSEAFIWYMRVFKLLAVYQWIAAIQKAWYAKHYGQQSF